VGTIISQPGITFPSPGVAPVDDGSRQVIALNASTTLVNTVINVPRNVWLRTPPGRSQPGFQSAFCSVCLIRSIYRAEIFFRSRRAVREGQ